ncbi:MAG: exopolysaccharide biosynthesis polyprenyl glycosylphosphotransferase [Verrucomicrobiae bacterium]
MQTESIPMSQKPVAAKGEVHSAAGGAVFRKEETSEKPDPRRARSRRDKRMRRVSILVFAWDTAIIGAALTGTFFLRFHIPAILSKFGVLESPVYGGSYVERIFVAGMLMLALLFFCDAYLGSSVLRFRKSFGPIGKAVTIWLLAYPGLSFVLKFDIGLSRWYVVLGFVTTLSALLVGRYLLQKIFTLTEVARLLRERILFIDWSRKAGRLAAATLNDPWHPYELIGCAPNPGGHLSHKPPEGVRRLNSFAEAARLCEAGMVDIVIMADGDRSENDIVRVATECEKTLVDFMVMPNGFQVLLSGLSLTTVSDVPLLGITRLRLEHNVNALMKRAVDIAGALVGLILSAPVIAVFCALVYRESPGPVFYRQTRVGRKGHLFPIFKIRSMRLEDAQGSDSRWTVKNDSRRLNIGALMRRLNIDELPQFWNVLRGDLSLVGPRPEQPEMIKRFRHTIPFYNARHNIIPGMTGWAQINGLRGDCDLAERIRYDLYYIENWSLIWDFQIMLLTFFRWKNAG